VTISVLLRLVPERLRSGTITGLVEAGERAVVCDAAELVAFLRGSGATEAQSREPGEAVEG
jgi:hypothetical protein